MRNATLYSLVMLCALASFGDMHGGESLFSSLPNVAGKRGLISSQDNDTMIINESGVFKLNSNFTSRISITANDVVLDLQGFGITSTLSPLISVAEGVHNVTIKNGTVSGDDATALQKGIACGVGVLGVTISDMHIKDCMGFGIDVVGTSTSHVQNIVITNCQARNNGIGVQFAYVDNAAVHNCELASGVTGMQLNNCEKICVQNSRAVGNTTAGFSLFKSSNNTFIECKAIDNGADANAFGFVSESGMCNIFDQCIAHSTETTGLDPFFAAGFLLTGSELQSKIVHSQASNGSGYGIRLEELIATITLSDEISATPVTSITELGPQARFSQGTIVNSADWLVSGTQPYLAIVSNVNSSESMAEVQILSFDVTTSVLSALTSATYETDRSLFECQWLLAGDSKYLAVAGAADATSLNQLRIFKFDESVQTVSLATSEKISPAPSQIGFTVDWLQSGGTNFLVASGDNGFVRVYSFDVATQMLTTLAGPTNLADSARVLSVRWQELNSTKYIALGSTNNTTAPDINEVRILEFDPAGPTLSAITSATFDHGAQVESVDWLGASGTLAIGGAISSLDGAQVRVLNFNQGASTLSQIESATFVNPGGGTMRTVQWLNCDAGPYLGMVGDKNGGFPSLRVYLFEDNLLKDKGLNAFDGTNILQDYVDFLQTDGRVFAAFGGFPSGGVTTWTYELTGCSPFIPAVTLTTTTAPICSIIKKNHITNNAGTGLQDDLGDESTNEIYANFSCKNGTNFNIGIQFPISSPDMQPVGATENIDCSLTTMPFEPAVKFTIVDQAESLCSKLDILLPCAPTGITDGTTINTAGSYCLANMVDGIITIANVRNVFLDLNNYAVQQVLITTATAVEVCNGIVSSQSAIACGIEIDNSCTVVLADLQVVDNADGLLIHNNSQAVAVRNCEFNDNSSCGVCIDGSNGHVFDLCTAHNNGTDGFLITGTGNWMMRCQAHDNMSNGFVITDGDANFLQECRAEGNTIGFNVTNVIIAAQNTIAACFAQDNTCGVPNNNFNPSASIEFGVVSASSVSGTSAPSYWSNVEN